MNHEKFDEGENVLFQAKKDGKTQFYSFDKVAQSYQEPFF
jgi:hypothetical protein